MHYMYITSLGRSGSTLLALLMNAHPEMVSIGELTGLVSHVNPDTYLCSCGQRIKECEFWNEVGHRMSDRGLDFSVEDFGTHLAWHQNRILQIVQFADMHNIGLNNIKDKLLGFIPSYHKRLKSRVDYNVALANTILEIVGKPVFVDASKKHNRIKYLEKYGELDLRVIHLVRDVRGFVNSFLTTEDNIGTKECALLWVKRNRQITRTLQSLPVPHLLIRYEDLCNDPLGTLCRVCEFCGVTPFQSIPEIDKTLHHVVGNRMRIRKDLKIKLDLRWQTELTPEQIAEIDRVSASLREVYEYPDFA
jgi:hypothetical protein